MPDTVDILLPSEKGAPLTRAEGEAQWIKVQDALNGLFDGSKKAGNADKLDGIDSTGFASSSHNHDTVYLGIGAKAVDSDKLDGYDSADYVRFAQVTGAFGNLDSPLLNLPLKKNLLTAQGQSVCTFTRASAATYVDRYGMLKSVAADTVRFTADGLFTEGASTNMLTYSEQFDNAAWNKSECSVSANSAATTDPFGTSLADKIVESTVNSKHQIYYPGISFTSGTAYTFSVYAKAAERTGILLSLPSAIFGTSEALFALSAGTATGGGATIKSVVDGWYRCSLTKTASSGGNNAVYLMPTQEGNPVYTGDGASGLYVFGAQLEAMPFATSYIATTVASATRAGNNIYIAQADNVPYYGANFSMCADVTINGIMSSAMYVCGESNLYVGLTSSGTVFVGFGALVLYTTATYQSGTRIRIAVVKSASVLNVYINGALALTGTISAVPANSASFYLGTRNGTSGYFYGHISNLRFYDRALTAEEARLA